MEAPIRTLRVVCARVSFSALALLVAGPAAAAPGPLEPAGPAWTSARGRERVRGDRADGAPVAGAWTPPPSDPGWGDRQSLQSFETTTFPPGASTLVTTPPEAWMKALREPELPIRWNGKTVEYLAFFRDTPRGKSMMRAWMRRAGRYESLIREILREHDVPEDLLMVALAESGFNPRVRSRVGAGGLWQFMEGTGQVYGLARSYWVDERFDPVKSTHAAAAYLKDLKTRFGSWELALAAYNAGYGLVMTAIDRHNTNNFWALTEIESGLPHATTNYIPKIMAAALVGRNRAAFGCGPGEVDPLPAARFVEVTVERSTALADVAELLEVDETLLAELNAQFIRERTPPRGTHTIRIPRESRSRWARAHERLAAKWQDEGVVTLREGEKLAALARQYRTSEKELRELNGVQDSAELRGGVDLIVPRSGQTDPGDAPPPLLAAVPPIDPGPGQELAFLEVTRASTPASISRSFGIEWEHIAGWNDLDPEARLQDGQVLQVVVPAGFSPDANRVVAYRASEVEHVIRGSREHIEAGLRRRGLMRRGYEVKRGDTLERIARKFALTVGDLARINAFSRTHQPSVGDVLVVYVAEGKSRGTVDAPPPAVVYGDGAAPSEASAPPRPAVRRPSPWKPRKPSTAGESRLPGRR